MNKKVAQFKLHVLIFKIFIHSIKKVSLEGDRKFSELKGDGGRVRFVRRELSVTLK